jgi:hypothetical protein
MCTEVNGDCGPSKDTIFPAMGLALDDFCDTEVEDEKEVVRGTVACPLGTNEDVVLLVNTKHC